MRRWAMPFTEDYTGRLWFWKGKTWAHEADGTAWLKRTWRFGHLEIWWWKRLPEEDGNCPIKITWLDG